MRKDLKSMNDVMKEIKLENVIKVNYKDLFAESKKIETNNKMGNAFEKYGYFILTFEGKF